MKSSTMKTISIIIGVLGLIGSIVAGNSLQAVDKYGHTSFNGVLMLYGFVGTFILFIILYGISAVLDNQENILSKINQVYNNTKEKNPASENSANSKLNLSALNYNNNNDGTWRCKKCGKTNQHTTRVCIDCGEYK